MFVLVCACDVMNVLSVKKNENLQKTKKKTKLKTKSKSELFNYFCFLAPKYFKAIWLSKILALGVPSNGIPETHRVHYIGYLRFYYITK
jgi:hypothetical protein